jgi:heme-degrading monooxygenase HmoA
MFAVIYRFEVRPGREEEFRAAWRAVTEALETQRGSLGARLHRAPDGAWISYAQWPSREHHAHVGDPLPSTAEAARARLRDCCARIETLQELEVMEDMMGGSSGSGI